MDCERLVAWAYQEELSKRHLSSAEGIWDRIAEDGQRGGVDKGHGAAQRYCHFGLPDPDAELIEKAVSALEDTVIDWDKSFDTIAAELSALISINEIARQDVQSRAPKAGWGKAGEKAVEMWFKEKPRPTHDRPRDVIMVGGLRTSALVAMHAVRGTRPDWREESPKPSMVPALKGPNAMIVGECRGRNVYSLGSYCPLKYEPTPLSIVSSRAEYIAWHQGLTKLAETLQLAKFAALPPKASITPWFEEIESVQEHRVMSVMPTPSNHVRDWGTLPLAPARERMGPALRTQRAGAVRYPLEEVG
jgi:hypothetical protein